MSTPRPANRLADESSPYLKQHANNPVDWYPWGPAALERARREDKPIFLSIGYSACHWCHVMEHESFEDDATAELLNASFVSIKVDREERPDVDQIYMNAVQALTGHGGWPMSVFLTPDLQPFFAGTYFPPEDRHGMPGFKRLLQSLSDAWQQRRDEINNSAGQITNHLREAARVQPAEGTLGPDVMQHALRVLERAFDPTHGGFGRAPKFPHPLELKLLLRVWKRFDSDEALHMVRHTLDRMAMGGMYDQLGGGFHRYSTDARWLVPHFEKMLYDNALLAQVYTEAFQATGEPFYREVVEETLAWVEREITSPQGPFYSTQDADSEGVEGKFFVWSAQEIDSLLGKELAEPFTYVYDVSPEGNWEGHNILNRSKSLSQNAKLLRMTEEQLRAKLNEARSKLFNARSQRIWPGRDEKVLTAWNGLMIAAFAHAAQVFDVRYAVPAARTADFILTKMRAPDGRLFRTWSAGHEPKLNAYLEDYTFLLDALVTLYEATFEPRWIQEALSLTTVLIEQFWDEKDGGFFFVGADHEQLIVRGKDPQDSSVPSGNSMAATALLRLAKLTGRRDLEDKAVQTMQLFGELIRQAPNAFGQLLVALDFQLGPVQEFAVVGPHDVSKEALRLIQTAFRPNKVVAWQEKASDSQVIPLLQGKITTGGEVTTYICKDYSCGEPAVGVEKLKEQLR